MLKIFTLKCKMNKKIPLPLRVNVIVTERPGNKPAVELRRNTTKEELIKAIIQAAYDEQPITILPNFSDKFRALHSLQEKGIIEYDNKTDKFIFVI